MTVWGESEADTGSQSGSSDGDCEELPVRKGASRPQEEDSSASDEVSHLEPLRRELTPGVFFVQR